MDKLVRLNYNMPQKLFERVEEYAESVGVNRTAALNMLVSLALKSFDNLDTLKSLLVAYEEQKKLDSEKSSGE